MQWNVKEDDIIRNLWGTKTAQEIADIIGDRTSNAVIARHKRLIGRKYGKGKFKPKVFKSERNPYNRPIETYTAYGIPATLNDCTGCRFQPEGTKLFCNAAIHKKSWCENHYVICYIKAKK